MPPTTIPAGPYQTRTAADGRTFPYYIVPFDKDGRCEGPLTRQHLLDHAGEYSDIFLFSHGWNNDWEVASKRYDDFIGGYSKLRTDLGLPVPADYKPLLVGIFWPSQAMAWFESETGPGFAGGGDAVEPWRKQLGEIADALPPDQRERFHALMQSTSLSADEARELAGILAAQLSGDDEGPNVSAPTADDLLAAAASDAHDDKGYDDDDDAVGTVGANARPDLGAAGLGDWLEKLDPRNLVKPFTVWQMKDRAGKVGGGGVSKLLGDLLQRSGARIHLLGHSYGCKVVMSAAAGLPDPLPRKIHSALLLQPAVSQYAFARKIPDDGRSGGYFGNLARIERPVLATFSKHDSPLTGMFHKAVRRKSDLGEQPVAAGNSPSRYGALGGFGPQDSDETIIPINDPPLAYDFGAGGRIIGVRGDRTIMGHGDISRPSTWWLAYSIASSR